MRGEADLYHMAESEGRSLCLRRGNGSAWFPMDYIQARSHVNISNTWYRLNNSRLRTQLPFKHLTWPLST